MIRRLLRTSGSCASSSERNFSATKRPPLRSKNLWLANCCFAHISLGFPFLLRFCDEQSGHSLYPFHGYPGPVARSWRRPFPSCGVLYPQAPTLDREAIPATIAEFMHLGPHPRRLDGALGTSHSSAPFRNRSEAFDAAWPSQSLEQAKVPRGSYRNVCRRCNGSGQCLNCEEPVRFQRGSCNYHT